ncbi:4229_t:CDS:2 [Funneliformis geosporum]|uniref:4229_t:CDS:1 n=1 Tax=Funneliformis geosporum TaxID=1117311 RepID=A0A9W4SPS0_9GLOM|nr:4229_t:CDS:2 [Funneliformis geosporum]
MLLRVESFTPKGRLAHSSVLVVDKLYFFGGAGGDTDIELIQIATEVFYLDVTKPFDIKIPPLTRLSNIPFGSVWATVEYNNINNDQNIYLFGGYMLDNYLSDSFNSIIYRFNVNSSTWWIPPVGGTSPERRRDIKAVNSDGKLYIFGGSTNNYLGSPTTKFFNDMIIFDTVGISWSIISSVDAPTQRALYTATLLPNGYIVYIGGYESKENGDITEVDIKQINLFDTNSLTWSLKIANVSSQIDNRAAHTAVLVQIEVENDPIKPNKNIANPIIIVIATISAIVGTGILSICGIFIYRWQRSRR